ncbi:MAG TPA: sigma-70 family RNA polymerase sigma factor [Chthoniobacterales bacterium]|nr:sigma-70 family RNA polymerase sigma factor [Chthoniobacterales bacterium]
MSSLLAIAQPEGDSFSSTHWSVIVAAGNSASEPERARTALAELCQTYWTPLYTFVRTRGYSVHDAQDLIQSFFAHLIEHEIYARTERTKGRFRSFLLAALKNFLADAYSRARALKRGGGDEFLPLDEDRAGAAESLFQTHCADEQLGEDSLFERSWAEALVSAGMEELSAEQEREGKGRLFHHLKIFLTGGAEPLPTYDELAAQMGIPASTLRSHVTRLRMRYRELLRAQVRKTVQTDAEVDGELHELFRVLSGA